MNKKILLIGPTGFRQGIWETRCKYIMPDLVEPLHEHCELHMVTARIPSWGATVFKRFLEKYKIIHHTRAPNASVCGDYSNLYNLLNITNSLKPHLITNIFGGATFGLEMTVAGKYTGAKTALRMAGDEIGSRILLGKYKGNQDRFDFDTGSQRLGVTAADSIIAMSTWEKKRIINAGASPEKVHICPRGIDLNKFSPRYPTQKTKARNFLYIGRKSAEKGYFLVEQAAKIIKKINPKVKFFFAGDFEPHQDNNCVYLGFVDSDSLPDLYESVDAVIMPSHTEGFPQVVAEGMCMSKPCILPKSIFKDMFTDGQEALLSENTPENLCENILRLTLDEKLCYSLGLSGRKYAEKYFDRNIWANMYRKIILEQTLGDRAK